MMWVLKQEVEVEKKRKGKKQELAQKGSWGDDGVCAG